METKQVKFKDIENNSVLYGIYVKNGVDSFIICGCCGRIIVPEEGMYEIIQEMEWIDIEYAICGE